MKLIKLPCMLSERECIGKHGETICDDTMFSLPVIGPKFCHTPILLAGKTKPTQEDWLDDGLIDIAGKMLTAHAMMRQISKSPKTSMHWCEIPTYCLAL